jgi:DNA-binding transcriptional LysR family regulator
VLNPLWLETLRAVVETGSFAGAARRLGYTPSAISQQMAGLERQANAALFERGRHGIKPTPAAVRLVERAAPLLARLAELNSDLQDSELAPTEPLRLGCFAGGLRYVLPALRRLVEGTAPPPPLSLTVGQTRQLVAAVYAGTVGIALVERYDLVPRTWPAEIMVRPVAEESLVLLLPADHRFAGRRHVQVRDLQAERWIAGSPDGDDTACLLRLCAVAGFRPDVVIYTEEPGVVPDLVRSHAGIALVPDAGPDPRVRPDRAGLVQVPLAALAPRRRVEVAHRAGAAGTAAAALLAALREPPAPSDTGHAELPDEPS